MLPTGCDFETESIENRPHYPPKPVGVAIKYPGKKAKYLAWGHPEGNNTTKEKATAELKEIFSMQSVVFHNAKFDLDVAETHLKIPPPPLERLHDTLLLAFLHDPHSRNLGLKPLSVKYLDRAPIERDDLKDWVIENVPEARRAKANWGAHISKAPGNIVAPYAVADTEMTVDLFKFLIEEITNADMLKPYQRELKLIPILLDSERNGVRVDLKRLEEDVPTYDAAIIRLDAWIRGYLNAPDDLNLDSNEQFADALESAGLVKDWIYTSPDKNGKGGGKRSTSKQSLAEMIEDKLFLAALEYRGSLATFNGTFLSKWLEIARETNGWVHTSWNSTAQEEGGGTRTGRLSSSKPTNFMNIPNAEKFDDLMQSLRDRGLFKRLKWLPELPKCRVYILPDDKQSVLIGRDFSSQEPRVLAHFEEGRLCEAYRADPRMDVYIFAVEEMGKVAGLRVSRKDMKIIILGILYGLGSAKLAEKLGITINEAKKFKEIFLNTFPEVKELIAGIRQIFRNNQPIRTWGGRQYHCEEPRTINGELRTFEYKGTNYLIQSSSADITKESVIRFHEAKKDSRFMLTVHDENLASCPKKVWKQEMKIMKECMEGIPLDVPLLSDGYVGSNWGETEDCE